MTIHSFERTDDVRVVSGLLAQSVLSYLNKPTEEDKATLPLNNFLRLLEMYRYDEFSAHRPKQGVLQRQTLSVRRKSSVNRSGFANLGNALLQAHKEAFGNEPRSEVVDTIESVIADLVNSDIQVDQAQRDKTLSFLSAFIRLVSPSG